MATGRFCIPATGECIFICIRDARVYGRQQFANISRYSIIGEKRRAAKTFLLEIETK